MRLKDDYSDAHNALGSVLMARGKYDEAIPHFEKAMSNLLWPSPYLAEQNMGWCLYKTGKTPEAIAHLKSAINLQPNLCGAYDELAQIYADQSKTEDAVVWMERYLKKCDSDELRKFLPPNQLSGVMYRLGMASVKLGAKDQARQYFSACAERFASDDTGVSCKKNLALLE